MTRFSVGVQLIVWGSKVLENLPGVLEEVSSIGFDGVETGLEPLKKFHNVDSLLREKGLKLAGVHMGIDSSDLDLVIEALNILERTSGEYLIFSGAGGRENTPENYHKSCKFLEKAGELASQRGLKVLYHNHWQEIINDLMGIRIICEETSAKNVSLCMDTYWVQCGGVSPLKFLELFGERVVYLHLKDGTEEGLKKHEFTELGYGIINFSSILKKAESLNVNWCIIEQDRTDKTPFESMKISRLYLKEKFGI